MTRDRALERVLLVQDVGIVVASLWMSHVGRELLEAAVPVFKPTVPVQAYGPLLLAFLPTWIWCAERLELNHVATLTGPPLAVARALVWTQAWGALAIALLLMVTQTSLNRSLIFLFLVISTALLLAAKRAQRKWVISVRGEAIALVLGGVEGVAEEVAELRGRAVEEMPSAGPDAVRERLRAGSVTEVVIAGLTAEDSRAVVEVCDEAGLPALVRLWDQRLAPFPPRVEAAGPAVYLTYLRREPDPGLLLVKSLIDRVVGTVALLISLPLMIVLALLVKLTSRGPALFIQTRGGLHGRPFPMLKFRTMRVGAEAERDSLLKANEMDGPVFKMTEDPRVTPLGRWLRRTSLDELPQFVNVALGHMSLVGPRPLPVAETRGLVGAYRRRLSVKPGLTCLWQVRGRNALPFRQWMALDLEYVDNWSLGLDLVIVLRTVPALLLGRGAK